MKNIHVLPTDNPSRLFKDDFGKYFISINVDQEQNHFIPQNIYITNSEEIKEGDYMFDVSEMTVYKCIGQGVLGYKIILTTDQDLIKDGVQAIDDEFLEWFVKNPSCEEVEVVEGDFIDGAYTFGKYNIRKMYYSDEPKDEPKQETLEEVFERFMKTNFSGQLTKGFVLGAMKFGAKWQQERSYSEEDMMDYSNYRLLIKKALNPKEWFEQFKNK